ncbi:DMT family transporter [Halosegnis longus]|uniref:DMT family transporter n=1 Tax=Halosegnis longus TaxID=2216012 RepID=A0AAJ4R973_9EURY|nr:DMT family transporter [Halosegnis longus]RNJ26486.1 DMT family transporter [Salella cibi]
MADRNTVLFLLLAAVWGSAFPVTRIGLDYLTPTLFASLRFYLATAVMVPLALGLGRDLHLRTRADAYYVVAGGLLTVGLHHALLFAGQQYVTSAVASVLLGLIPVVTPALQRAVGTDETIAALDVVGVLVGFAGVIVIANPDLATFTESVRGAALVFGSAVAFAAGAVFTDRVSPTLDAVGAQPWMYLIGAVSLHLATVLLPGSAVASATVEPRAILAVGYMAVVAGVGGFTLYFVLLRELGPFSMGLLEYVIPPFAALTGYLLLQEPLSETTLVGFALVVVGFLVVKRRQVADSVAFP